MLLVKDSTLARVETLQQLWREVNAPAANGRMIDPQAAFDHHLFEITKAEIVSEVSDYAQQDHRSVEMAAFEVRHLSKYRESIIGRRLAKSLRRSLL